MKEALDLEAIRERCEKATANVSASLEFMAHAPADVAALLAEIERLRAKVREFAQECACGFVEPKSPASPSPREGLK